MSEKKNKGQAVAKGKVLRRRLSAEEVISLIKQYDEDILKPWLLDYLREREFHRAWYRRLWRWVRRKR